MWDCIIPFGGVWLASHLLHPFAPFLYMPHMFVFEHFQYAHVPTTPIRQVSTLSWL